MIIQHGYVRRQRVTKVLSLYPILQSGGTEQQEHAVWPLELATLDMFPY